MALRRVFASAVAVFRQERLAVLRRLGFRPGMPEFGEALETIVFHELTAFRDYVSGEPLAYWRSTSGFEVDFVIDDHTAIEVKAKENVSPQDLERSQASRVGQLVAQAVDQRDQRVAEDAPFTAEVAHGFEGLLPCLLGEKARLSVELLRQAQAGEAQVVFGLAEPALRLGSVLVLAHNSTPSARADASTPRGSRLRRANSAGV
jgi:hypothetical protein